jgi:ribonucleoside-diphosphate reductase beta chain
MDQNVADVVVVQEEENFKAWESDEPLLKEDIKRLLQFPILHSDIYEHYKNAQSNFWVMEEVDFEKDSYDWQLLTVDEQGFILRVLAYFAGSDGIVSENLAQRFYTMVQYPEARSFYAFQMAIEHIHAETYHMAIDVLPCDQATKENAMRGIETSHAIKVKADWALRWIAADDVSFHERLVAFACVEGIHFSASFCAIFWLMQKSIMPGFIQSNELISRDEGMHTDFAVLLYTSHLVHKLPQARVHAIVKDAVNVEITFVREALHVGLIGMNAEMMEAYVCFVADRLLQCLGYDKLFNATNPFPWMVNIGLPRRGNFFERKQAGYQHSAIAGRKDRANADAPKITDENDSDIW